MFKYGGTGMLELLFTIGLLFIICALVAFLGVFIQYICIILFYEDKEVKDLNKKLADLEREHIYKDGIAGKQI